MTDEQVKALADDETGLKTYEFLANNIGDVNHDDIEKVVDNMSRADRTGQFTASAARYLHAINPEVYADAVRRLVGATIDRDREHRYLPELMESIYGKDCVARAEELSEADNNFRRLYKRLYPSDGI